MRFTPVDSVNQDSIALPLTYEQRLKSRLLLNLASEQEAQILLPRGQRLRPGQHLAGADGSLLRVELAEEEISLVRAEGEALARASYHLGNRHIPAAISVGTVAYLKDPVIDAMMEGLGFVVEHRKAGFEPEPGAYAGHHHA